VPARCFLAIELSRGVLRVLGEAERALVHAQDAWAREKWVRADLRHITVKFIGPLPDDAVPGVLAALTAAVRDHAPMRLRLSDVRAMPSSRRASMLWGVFDGDVAGCAALAAVCDRVLAEQFGVDPEPRGFRPHTTLARTRSARRLSATAIEAARAAIAAGKDADRTVSVRSVTLFSSTLHPNGPEYVVLGSVPLGR
jgi:RNA 2',3'-cyclic 3'-phosphodiesterase